MRGLQRTGETKFSFSYRLTFLLSAFFASILLFTTGCGKAPPMLPDADFAEKYLKEQTYYHCMRYQNSGTIYDTMVDGHYVFFSMPEAINYAGWTIKDSRKDVKFNCMFRRYNHVGHVYHKLINYHVMPLEKTDSGQYTYTTTMKIEYICVDKMYHDDAEYNASMIWLYDPKKYTDFSKLDLLNQFGMIWKPGHDLLLLTRRMLKDTSSEKKMKREISLRYDSENLSWQWLSCNGKWRDDFNSVVKLEDFPQLPDAHLLDADIAKNISPDVTLNHKLMILEHAAYLCDSDYEALLTRFLKDRYLFFSPGQKDPMWLDKDQYNASKRLLELTNKIMIEHQKISTWQALQALNKHYQAIAPLQNIVWNRVEKDLTKVLDMLCNTDFIEDEKKEMYLNKFVQRLGECSNLKNHPRYNSIISLCTERLNKIRTASAK